jgi:gliding motility-associated-like protein
MNELSEAPTPVTAAVGEQIFYVSQINETLQCESATAEIKVKITSLPEPDFEAPDKNICYGDSPVISLAKLHDTYVYDIYSDIQLTEKLASVTGNVSDNVSLSTIPEASTSYYVLVTDSLSCAAQDLVEVKIDVTKLEISPAELPVYAHEVPYSVQLESNAEEPIFSYTGSFVTGIDMTSDGLISGTVPESAGREESTFTVTVTDKNGCQTNREYLLRTCEPAPDLLSDTVIYCQAMQAYPLQASSPNGNILQWYDAELNRLDETPVPVTTVTGKQVFYVSQINEALQCEGEKAQITVLVNPAPTAVNIKASANDVCFGDSPSILLEDIDEKYSYFVYSDNTFYTKLDSLTGVTFGTVEPKDILENNTVYYILVTDSLGCTSIDWMDVPVEVIKLYIQPEKLPQYYKNVDYEQILLTNAQSPVFTIIEGNLPDGLSLNSSGTVSGQVPNSEHSLRNVFTVKVQDLNGCIATWEYTLTGDIFVPKVFTPNGDGINDIFMPENKVVIFDRLGIEIYKGENGWDGTYKGKPVDSDIYFYKLEYIDGDGITKILTGYVGVHY